MEILLMLLQNAPVNFNQPPEIRVRIMHNQRAFPGAAPEPGGEIVVEKNCFDAFGKFHITAARKQNSFVAVVNQITDAADLCRDDRHPEKHRLTDRVRRILDDGRTDKNIRVEILLLHLLRVQLPQHRNMR